MAAAVEQDVPKSAVPLADLGALDRALKKTPEELAAVLPPGHLETFTVVFTGEAALNWVLTRDEVASLRSAAAGAGVQAELGRFVEWIHPVGEAPVASSSPPP